MPAQRGKRKIGEAKGNPSRSPEPAEKRARKGAAPSGRVRPTRSAVLLDPDPGWLGVVEQTLAGLGVEVVGTAEEPSDALVLIVDHAPDLLVFDIRTPGGEMEGLTCVRRAREEVSHLKAIVLSGQVEPEHVAAAFRAGASAYIAKPTDPADLATAIRQVFERSIFLPGTAVGPEESVVVEGDQGGLTQRELEVIRLVAEGRSNAEVAKIMWVTEQTIKFHLSNVYRKLGVANRSEARHRAHALGLLSDARDADGDRMGASPERW
jgi:DNA-binding NarL/FixJ family response regulator